MTNTAVVPSQFIIKRPPQTPDELWWYVYALFGVKIPRTQVCHNHVSPFEAFYRAYFAMDTVVIWKASRGFGGKSFQLSLLSLVEAVALGAESTVLGGSGAQSLNVHTHSVNLWAHHNAPTYLLQGEPTKFDTFLSNTGHIRSLMASQTSVRGPHPQRLRLDEIDEMKLSILEGAQGQPMRKVKGGKIVETQTVMSSTHQYPDGTMTEMIKRAKDRGWPLLEWCWKETSNTVDGWLTQDEVDRQRSIIPTHMWEAEYDLQEPNFEGRAMDSDLVTISFNDGPEYDDSRPIFHKNAEQGCYYVTGIDWAKQKDMTIIATFKVSETDRGQKFQCVAWQKINRLQWPVMILRAVDQWRRYGGRLKHDATGIGNVVNDLLKEYMTPYEYKNVRPYVMTGGQIRASLFSEYCAAIEQQDITYPMIPFAYDEHRYAAMEDLYGKGHPPDSIVAGALAWTERRTKITVESPIGLAQANAWSI